MVARGKAVFFPVTYVLLLGAALFHGLYGLRNILLELNPAPGLKKAIGAVLAARRASGCSPSGPGPRWPATRWPKTL